MKTKLFIFSIILLTQLAVSLRANAGNTVVNKGTITIYVGEEKTMYHSIPYEYYVTSDGWFLRDTSGSAWSDGQEMCGAKIVSKNSSSCTIKGMWDNDGGLSWCELHCKGTKSNGEYYECYWKVIVKSYGTLKVNASPTGGRVDEGTVITLSATSNGSTVSGCDIYYTLDGTTPTKNSNKYTSSGISITKSGWLKANAYKTGYMTYENIPDEWYFTVTPADIKVTSITLNKMSLSLQPDGEETLTATVKPDNATNKTVTWTSSNESAATVNNGKVKAVATGSATITCTANDGSGVKATCTVTVNKPTGIDINATNFPDANFRNYLLSQSYGQDGVLTDKEIKEVTNISVNGNSISSLKGIEFFTALKELWCYDNHLTSLDISKNTALEYLYCNTNQLTSLDVSKNTVLRFLFCANNQLTSLDVSKNTALNILYCANNQLTSLDVSKNTALNILYCYNNQLTSLDVSKNTVLTGLYCYNNHIKGTDMDNLISSLPQNMTNDQHQFWVIDPTSDSEGNVCTKAQVAVVKAKGWFPCYYDTKEYVEYEGSEEVTIIKGDVNGDGYVNGTDLVALTNIILGKSEEKACADVNGDGNVNGTDYVVLVNIILGKSNARTY